MDTEPKQPVQSDEIDLRTLFQAIGSFFSRMGMGIIIIFVRIRQATFKYKILILTLTIVVAAGSVLVSIFKKPVYETTGVLRCSYLDNQLMESKIVILNKLCSAENRAILAQSLGIDSLTASKIKSFEFEPFVSDQELINNQLFEEQLSNLKLDQDKLNAILQRLKIQNAKTFTIRVYLTEPTLYKKITEPVIKYFESSPYVKSRIQINGENLVDQRLKILSELNQIDSLKKILFKYIEKASNGGNSGATNILLGRDPSISDPLQVFNKDFEMYKNLQDVEKAIFLKSDFEVIEDFTPDKMPASLSTKQRGLIGLGIGVGLAYLLIILIEFNKYLNRVEKERLSDTD